MTQLPLVPTSPPRSTRCKKHDGHAIPSHTKLRSNVMQFVLTGGQRYCTTECNLVSEAVCKGLESHISLISLKGRESAERTLLPTKPSLAELEQTAKAVTTH